MFGPPAKAQARKLDEAPLCAITSLNLNLQVRRAAELDIAEAQVWYETQRSGLGAQFHLEISQIFNQYQTIHLK